MTIESSGLPTASSKSKTARSTRMKNFEIGRVLHLKSEIRNFRLNWGESGTLDAIPSFEEIRMSREAAHSRLPVAKHDLICLECRSHGVLEFSKRFVLFCFRTQF